MQRVSGDSLQVSLVFSCGTCSLLIWKSHTQIGELCVTCLCYLFTSLCLFLRQSRHNPKATKTLPQAEVSVMGETIKRQLLCHQVLFFLIKPESERFDQ